MNNELTVPGGNGSGLTEADGPKRYEVILDLLSPTRNFGGVELLK